VSVYVATIKGHLSNQPWSSRSAASVQAKEASARIESVEGQSARLLLSASSIEGGHLWVLTDSCFYLVQGSVHPVSACSGANTIVSAVAAGNSVAVMGPATFLVLKNVGNPQCARRIADQLNQIHEQRIAGDGAVAVAAVLLPHLTVVHGMPGLTVGGQAMLVAYRDRIELEDGDGVAHTVPLADVDSLGTGGPGAVAHGGGFIGGGFGLEGAAVGMVAAGLLNHLSTRVTIQTLIYLRAATCELLAVSDMLAPHTIDGLLVPAYTALRAQEHARQEAVSSAPSSRGELAEELTKLAALHAAGALDDSEFRVAKTRLLQD
jgi:hypothetical protein